MRIVENNNRQTRRAKRKKKFLTKTKTTRTAYYYYIIGKHISWTMTLITSFTLRWFFMLLFFSSSFKQTNNKQNQIVQINRKNKASTQAGKVTHKQIITKYLFDLIK